ncbi:MAG: alpha/beta hydrolase, partial [Chitinophagales bacterium]
VLKYRLIKSETNDPIKEMYSKASNIGKFAIIAEPVVSMALKDISTAITYLRTNAREMKINPERIGIIGFSAGGTLAAGMAYNYEANTRPAFVAALYPWIDPIKKKKVQNDAPPIFIAAASDDQLGFDIGSTEFYLDWAKFNHSAELHLYEKGGHGFVVNKQGLPVDGWIDRFGDWLKFNGFLNK